MIPWVGVQNEILWLIVWRLTPFFQQYFSNIAAASLPIHAIPGVSLTSTPLNILAKPLAFFPHNHRRNNGER